MKQTIRVVAFLSVTMPLLMAFQNCSKGGFSTAAVEADSGVNLNLANDRSVVRLKSTPDSLTNLKTGEFEIEISSDKSSIVQDIEYSLDGGAWKTVGSMLFVDNLETGNHKVSIRAVSKDGSRSEAIDYIWFVDLSKPEVVINTKPPAVTSETSASFEFSASDSHAFVSKILCFVDNEEVPNCSSPLNLQNLSRGMHKVEIKAKDQAGNFSDVSSYEFRVAELQVKSVIIQLKPEPNIRMNRAEFAFASEGSGEEITSYYCKLDENEWSTCNASLSLEDLSEGLHKLTVKGRSAGGLESAPVDYQWRVDSQAPTLSFMTPFSNFVLSAGEPAWTGSALAGIELLNHSHVVGFSAQDDNGSGIQKIECKLESYVGESLNLVSDFASCASPFDQSMNLSGGVYRLTVRASDKAGNEALIASQYRMPENNVPFMTINLAGGAALMANLIPLNANKELLPTYSRMGMGTIPTVEMEMGGIWYSGSGMLAGIREQLTPLEISKVKVFSIANVSQDDKDTNKLMAHGMIEKMGRKGAYQNFIALGGPRNQPAGFSPSSILESYSLFDLAGYFPTIEAQGKIDPRVNAELAALWKLDSASSATSISVNGAAITQLVIDGHLGSGSINLGGYDYHDGTRTRGDRMDKDAGALIAKVIKMALIKNKKLVINLTTDGAVRSAESDIPGGAWVSDGGQAGTQIFFVVDPTASVEYGHYFIGSFNNGQSVDATSVAYDKPEKAAAIMACNYAFFNGKSSCAAEVNNLLTDSEIESTRVILPKAGP